MLLLLALGVIEIGRYAYIAILVGNAARAGAAFGSQSHAQAGQQNNIATAAKNDYQNNGQDPTKLNVSSTFSCGCDSGGTVTPSPIGTNATCFVTGAPSCSGGGHWVVTVSVTASGNYNSLFNYPGIPSSIAMSRLSQMRVKNWANEINAYCLRGRYSLAAFYYRTGGGESAALASSNTPSW
jgi:Flp pilus assembly protein TadG